MGNTTKKSKSLSNKTILARLFPAIIFIIAISLVVIILNHSSQKNDKQSKIINELINVLNQPSMDIHVKAATIQALGKIGNKNAANIIISQVDEHPYLLDVGTSALSNMGVDLDYNELLARPSLETDSWLTMLFKWLKNYFHIEDPLYVLNFTIFIIIPNLILFLFLYFISRTIFRLYFKEKLKRSKDRKIANRILTTFQITVTSLVFFVCIIHYFKAFNTPISTATPNNYQVILTKIEYAGKQKNEKAIPMLAEILLDTARQVELRWRSAYSLGRIGKKEAESILRKALVDTNLHIRQYTVWAIGNINASSTAFENSANPLIMYFCPNCGKPVKPSDNFCQNCSFKIERTFKNNPKSD